MKKQLLFITLALLLLNTQSKCTTKHTHRNKPSQEAQERLTDQKLKPKNNERWLIKDRISGKSTKFKTTKEFLLKTWEELKQLEQKHPSEFKILNEMCIGGSPKLTDDTKIILRKYHTIHKNNRPSFFIQGFMNCIINNEFWAIKDRVSKNYIPLNATVKDIGKVLRRLRRLKKRHPKAFVKLNNICANSSNILIDCSPRLHDKEKIILKKYHTININNQPYSFIKKMMNILIKIVSVNPPKIKILGVKDLISAGTIKKIRSIDFSRLKSKSINDFISAGYIRQVMPTN